MDPMTHYQSLGVLHALFNANGLNLWTVSYSRAKRTAGTCDHRMKVITLSKYLMAQRSYEDTMNTITHEVAHALTPGHGHDAVWARQHRALGGDGKRCFQHTDEQAPWIGECPHGKTFARYRAPKRLDGWRCRCGGTRALGSAVTWKKREAA